MADYLIDKMESGRMPSGYLPKPRTASYTKTVAMNAGVLHNMDYDGGAYYQIKNSKELGNVAQYIAVVNFIHALPGWGAASDKDYDFFCNIPLSEGDVVVVDTVHGLNIAKVVGVKKTSSKATNWVVQRVDLSEHQARIEAEQKKRELEKAMAVRAKEIEKMKRYKELAYADILMKELVDEYMALESGTTALVGAPIISPADVQATNDRARQAYEDHADVISRDRERVTYEG